MSSLVLTWLDLMPQHNICCWTNTTSGTLIKSSLQQGSGIGEIPDSELLSFRPGIILTDNNRAGSSRWFLLLQSFAGCAPLNIRTSCPAGSSRCRRRGSWSDHHPRPRPGLARSWGDYQKKAGAAITRSRKGTTKGCPSNERRLHFVKRPVKGRPIIIRQMSD